MQATPFQFQSTAEIPTRKDRIVDWIDKKSRVRVTISDKRIFTGILLCVDCYKNLILADCFEYQAIDEKQEESKSMGLAMIPGEHIVSCWIETE